MHLRALFATVLFIAAPRVSPAEPPRPAVTPRILVLDFLVQGDAPRGLGRALGDTAAAEAIAVGGASVMSQGDITTQLGLERSKQMLGCAEDESCMVEIAGALAADRLLAGAVTFIDGTYLLSVKLVDARRGRSVGRAADTLRGPTQAELVDAVRRLAHEALTGKKLDTTGVLHIDVEEDGAFVALDGREIGKSPVKSGQRVIQGPHRITVQKPGYVSWEGAVDVAAGANVPVAVKLVPYSAIEAERRVFVEVYGGFTVAPHYSVNPHLNCEGGCVANMGGVRGGYIFGDRFTFELFLVPYAETTVTSYRSVTVNVGRLNVSATAPRYEDQANIGATYGGLSTSVRFLERTPIVLRLSAGEMRGNLFASSGGRFPDAPSDSTGHYDHGSVSQPFWSWVAGGEVSVGYRFSRAILMSVATGIYVIRVPSTYPETGAAIEDSTVRDLPSGPAFQGGTAWFIPVNLALRWDI